MTEMHKCLGTVISRRASLDTRHQCTKNIDTKEKFCKVHIYMKNYTALMMNNLSVCKTCWKFYYLSKDEDKCDDCKNNKGKVRCSGFRMSQKDKKIVSCESAVSNIGDFCCDHDHQKDLTKEQIKELAICSGCKRVCQVENGSCKECRKKATKKGSKN
jgi:hypothetical protein